MKQVYSLYPTQSEALKQAQDVYNMTKGKGLPVEVIHELNDLLGKDSRFNERKIVRGFDLGGSKRKSRKNYKRRNRRTYRR
jgi:hypothetical protein